MAFCAYHVSPTCVVAVEEDLVSSPDCLAARHTASWRLLIAGSHMPVPSAACRLLAALPGILVQLSCMADAGSFVGSHKVMLPLSDLASRPCKAVAAAGRRACAHQRIQPAS